jgi:putative metal-binding protein/slime mold repeat-containing protein
MMRLLASRNMRPRLRTAALSVLVLAGCGSRTDPELILLPPPLDVSGPQVECYVDDDCETTNLCSPRHCMDRVCVGTTVRCADDDPCTEDACDPRTGECVFEPLTADLDGDGFRRPLPGFLPGQPGACGDDCNDASSLASPAGVERCDGLDNDCDGIIDNGALFSPSEEPALLLSRMARRGTPGGLTFSDSGGTYGAVFTQLLTASQNTFSSIQPRQLGVGPAVPVTEVNSDTFAGPIVGRGSVFATAWEDRRDQNYEIYFNRLNVQGEKLGPDLRVTQAAGFSLRPTLLEVQSATGYEYRLAWEDERNDAIRSIYGQRLSEAGALLGDNVELTPLDGGMDPTSPSLVAGTTRLGLLFNLASSQGRGLGFRSFDFDFGSATDQVVLQARNPDAASIVANAGRFVVAWHVVEAGSTPGTQIWGSVISELGEPLITEKALTEPAAFARYNSIVSLGDRLILLWSEWRMGSYQIYSRELTPDLDPLGPARAVTSTGSDAYAPLAAFGPEGEIGVLFTGQREGSGELHAFFTSLSCDADADFSLPR